LDELFGYDAFGELEEAVKGQGVEGEGKKKEDGGEEKKENVVLEGSLKQVPLTA